MIGSEEREDPLKQLAEICRFSYTIRELPSLKQKFQNFEFPDDEQIDPVVRAAITKELHQIQGSQTLERARHYVNILLGTLEEDLSQDLTELNLKLWKGYDHIYTDSLWTLGSRARDENHKAWYWGNFVPQIPFQLISRYTAPGDWVLDPFCGSGTTLMEAMKLGRNSLGIELNSEVYRKTSEALEGISGTKGAVAEIEEGNSLEYDFLNYLGSGAKEKFKLAILHPPYWDIIKFSEDKKDLSNASSLEDFTDKLKSLTENILEVMKPRGHVALVIGDMYRNGEIVPLGFRSMDALSSTGLKLRGIIVKDIQNTRAKRSSESLWRYRALKSGFYVFKHEYVFVFKTP